MTGWSASCPAKVNLFLRILAREDTGYHQIETLFQAIGLFDRVEALPGEDGITLEVRRETPEEERRDIVGDLGDPDSNTVLRAARTFYAVTGLTPAVSLILTKAIPAGTGLGGGSSDAAGTLAALNALHGAPLSAEDLIATGAGIGADVPFFGAGAATAFAWGRGDRMLACPPPPPAPLVLAVPHARVSTAAAYRETSAALQLPAPAGALEGVGSGEWTPLAALQWNDFERAVFARLPELARIRAEMAAAGALIARMTGSGSAVFGVFGDRAGADAAARRIATIDGVGAVRVVSTLSALPTVTPAAAPPDP